MQLSGLITGAVRTFLIALILALPVQAADETQAADAENGEAADATTAPQTALERLHTYITAGDVYHARFIQSVYSESGDLLRESTGEVTLAPPTRFRWVYEMPFPQLIVSNGEQLSLYDEDLEQVTIYDSNSALQSSPIMMFRDPESLERSFEMRSLESEDGMMWVEMVPIDTEADFSAVYVALDSSGMRVLEMRDKLGQATQIRFDHLQVTQSVNDALFEFEIPDGADVIRP